MENNIPTLFITVAVSLLLPLNALNLEGAKESKCFEIKKTITPDLNWAMSQKTWYYTQMSRLDLYLTATEKLDKKDLTEDQLYYDSCITFGTENGKFVAKGFNGLKVAHSAKPIKGMEVYESFSDDGSKVGTCYTTLTDNKSFMFTACCTEYGQMTWNVASTMKRLPKKTVQLIHEHAESLGFKKEFFTGLRYDHCKLDDDKEKESKVEL